MYSNYMTQYDEKLFSFGNNSAFAFFQTGAIWCKILQLTSDFNSLLSQALITTSEFSLQIQSFIFRPTK